MGHPMFEYDATLADEVFDYCRDRLSMDPVPLDYGSLNVTAPGDMKGFIRPEGHDPDEILEFFKNELAPSVVSIDSPGFLAFIPNAPTKNSLLFDMVVACSGLNGTSWLESSGVVLAENLALAYLAELAGMPEGSGGAFVSGGSLGNLSSLTVGRDVGRAKRPNLAPHEVRYAISSDAHSSIGKALHVLGVEPLVVTTDDHRFTRAALEAGDGEGPESRQRHRRRRDVGDDERGHRGRPRGSRQLRARTRPLVPRRRRLRRGGAVLTDRAAPARRTAPRRQLHRRSRTSGCSVPSTAARCSIANPTVARKVLAQQAGYLDILHSSDDEHYEWNPSDFAIHLSRRARGLPFWFSLVTNGTAAYESAVQCAVDLAHRTQAKIEALDYVEMVRPISLSIVLFRRKGWTPERYTEWSHQLLRDQIAFVTPTKWEGETVGRLAFLHPNTTDELVDQILESMRD